MSKYWSKMSEESKEASKKRNAAWYKELKPRVLNAYGAVCSCCKETRFEFLTLDHVNGGGRQHLKNNGNSAHYKDAIRRNFPSDYRVLCMNCNFSIGHYGYCPHEKEKQ